jgi:hypothetical protein
MYVKRTDDTTRLEVSFYHSTKNFYYVQIQYLAEKKMQTLKGGNTEERLRLPSHFIPYKNFIPENIIVNGFENGYENEREHRGTHSE